MTGDRVPRYLYWVGAAIIGAAYFIALLVTERSGASRWTQFAVVVVAFAIGLPITWGDTYQPKELPQDFLKALVTPGLILSAGAIFRLSRRVRG
jgi:hypothetical protein